MPYYLNIGHMPNSLLIDITDQILKSAITQKPSVLPLDFRIFTPYFPNISSKNHAENSYRPITPDLR